MEHQAVEFAAVVGDHRIGRARAGADDAEAWWRLSDTVAVAHPDLIALARLPHPLEQRARFAYIDQGATELAMVRSFDAAAQLCRHGHLAIADPEDRHAHLEDALRRTRRRVLMHRGGTAGKDDGLGREGSDSLLGYVEGMDLAIDTALAHAPRDELGHLAAEIEDEDTVGHGLRPSKS